MQQGQKHKKNKAEWSTFVCRFAFKYGHESVGCQHLSRLQQQSSLHLCRPNTVFTSLQLSTDAQHFRQVHQSWWSASYRNY